MVLFSHLVWQSAELLAHGFESSDRLGGRFYPFRGKRDKRNGHSVRVGRQLASVLLPELPQQTAECLRLHQTSERGELLDRDAGRHCRTGG